MNFVVTVTINGEPTTYIIEEHQPTLVSDDGGDDKVEITVRHNGSIREF